MTVDKVIAGIAMAENHPSAWFAGPREPELVERAEQALGFRFPLSLREFILKLGAGSVGAEEIYGVTNDEFQHGSVPNGVWLTLDARSSWGLSSNLFVVYFDGGVDYYVVDCDLHDPPVEVWRPGVTIDGCARESIAQDFGSFFLALVEAETKSV